MRLILCRILLLVGFAVAIVPANTAAQPATLAESAQNESLKIAQKKAQLSAAAKKGNFKVDKIAGVTNRPATQLAGTRITPAQLREKKSKAKTLLPSKAAAVGAKLDPAFNLLDKVGSAFPVQDQGNCGSCWIFAAVSGHAASILYKSKSAPADLSEQYVFAEMFRENNDDPCKGGWPEQPLKFLKANGTFSRSDFPYSPTTPNQPSSLRPGTAPFRALDWGYVGGDNLIPPPDELKKAIQTYGSVIVAVHAGDAFINYKEGIFGTTDFPPNQINHAVTLIGWDDNPPEFASDPGLRQGTDGGVWILRNSWGPAWGESGNMRIAYNTNNVGFGAMWVDADATGPAPPQPPDDKCPTPSPGYQKHIQERIQFYEKNYKQYLPK